MANVEGIPVSEKDLAQRKGGFSEKRAVAFRQGRPLARSDLSFLHGRWLRQPAGFHLGGRLSWTA